MAIGKSRIVAFRRAWKLNFCPKDFADGVDCQLEEGVRIVLEELKAKPVPEFKVPPYPNYHKMTAGEGHARGGSQQVGASQ